ncbi:MAG: formylglycine-generating enzyme family protein [Planctomycetota bacterium]
MGQFRANGFGLHDVSGNVWEWCEDKYVPYDTPVRPGNGLRLAQPVDTERTAVFRGCGYHGMPDRLRIAHRGHRHADGRFPDVGVRPARDLER